MRLRLALVPLALVAAPALAQERGTVVIVTGEQAVAPVPTIGDPTTANNDVADQLFLRLAVPGPGQPTSGDHGFLPENADMDAAFFLAGPGVPAGLALGRVDMRDIAPTLAGLLRVPLPAAEGRDVLQAARK